MEKTVTKQRVLVIIPAYREEKRLGAVLRSIFKERLNADLLVVDDGSPDATAVLALKEGAKVARHPINLGYGAALQTGYRYALEHGYQAVAQMDADGQHEAKDLRELLAPVLEDRADLVIGSRWLGKGDYTASFSRRLGQRLFSFLASTATGVRITDPTSGFKAAGSRLLSLYASRAYPADYPDADWLLWLSRQGARIVEVPVSMYADGGKAHGLHVGLKPLFYLPKVLLSFGLNLAGRR
jgi:glycosyltransferase involved in cell wall biosynthesis